MTQRTKKQSTRRKPGRVKVDDLQSEQQELTAQGLKKVKGGAAAQNQKAQDLTFNLQQIQQTLNRVNETVTNLKKE